MLHNTMAVVSEQCTYVVSRDNETLESRQDDCSIPKMGVCINTSCEYKSSLKVLVSVNLPDRF